MRVFFSQDESITLKLFLPLVLTNIPGDGEKDEEEEVVDVMVVLMVQVGSATRVRSDVSEISFSFVFCVGAAIQDRNSWLHLQF